MTKPIPQMDKISKELVFGLSELARMAAEADPEGISAELAFFLLVQCERMCDKLRIKIQDQQTKENARYFAGFSGIPT